MIVPARDAASTIGPCIDALVAAGVAADVIIVVDDGSRDATAAIARGRGATCLETAGGVGAAAARNHGVARSAADPIVFVDADVCVAPDAIAKIAAAFAAEDAPDALFGSYDDAPPAPGITSRVRNLLHHHVHQTNAGPAETFWTGLGAIRRRAFDGVGGFAAGQRMMEDIRLGYALRRAGYRIALRPDIQGAHLKRWTLRSMIRTDLMDRAIPWSRLLLEDGGASPALNVSPQGKLSVFAACLAALVLAVGIPLAAVSLPAAAAALAIALACLLSIASLNRAFLHLVGRRLGLATLPPAILVLWLHYLASGCGFAWVRAEMALNRGSHD